MANELEVQERNGGARFWVHVKPRASKSRVLGVKLGKLEVSLAAPPVDGAANQELVLTLAEALDVGRRAVSIVAGEGSRTKLVQVEGASGEAVRAKLARA